MTRYLPAAAILAATCLLTACSSSSTHTAPAVADTASCEQALIQQLKDAYANPNGPSSTRPAACAGIDDATLQKLGMQALASAPVPTPTDLPS
jgi:hypothetical protein